jgi:alpha-1,2-mannosyltransferase
VAGERGWPLSGGRVAGVVAARGGRARPRAGTSSRRRIRPGLRWRPVPLVIAVTAGLGLALRVYQLSRPGYLTGVTEYDDGPYFGSSLGLLAGSLPYRDYVFVQPPGITVLMAPAAGLAAWAGSAWAMVAGRILTTLASTAQIVLAGLLVRHRGPVAAGLAGGLLACYPASVAAAHTVLVEPWLALFCLAGTVAAFDRGRLAEGHRRLAAAGAGFGFAGAVEGWAAIPVLVVLGLCLSGGQSMPGRGLPGVIRRGLAGLRRAGSFAAGVTAGFAVPVLPFAALAPGRFYRDLIVAQIGPRAHALRVAGWIRLADMTGLANPYLPVPRSHLAVVAAAVVLAALAAAAVATPVLATGRRPAPLAWFGVLTAGLTAAAFWWPSQFHYHFPAFLAPFLAVAVALGVTELAAAHPGRRPGAIAAGLGAAVLAAFAVADVQAGSQLRPFVGPAAIAAVRRAVPAGSCVATDEVSLLILADRFGPPRAGCPVVLDGLGTDLALSGGRSPATGAGRVPAVAAVWRRAFGEASYVWLSVNNARRVAWTPALRRYLRTSFVPVLADRRGDTLYRRRAAASSGG